MERNTSIDVAKFFAIFFVVIIHVQPFRELHIGYFDGEILSNLLVTLGRFAVPFFFIVSGYLLCEKIKHTTKPNKHFIGYVIKNTKLYLSWLIFYFIFDISITILEAFIKGLSLTVEIKNYLNQYSIWKVFYFGTDTTSYPLWFLLALIWSVIIISLFYKFNKIGLLLVISLVLNVIGQFGQSYYGFLPLPIDTKDAIFFGLFYTALGFFISKHYQDLMVKINLKGKQLVILFIVFTVVQILERTILMGYFGGKSGNYYLTTIPLTISLLLLVLKFPNAISNSFIINIGKNAVGIFVSHNLLINVSYYLVSFLGITFILDTIFWQILFVPLIFITSYYFYRILQTLKGKVRKFLSGRGLSATTNVN